MKAKEINVEGVTAKLCCEYEEERRQAEEWTEQAEMKAFAETVSATDVVWDIGANIGAYSLVAANRGATVHSFELVTNTAVRLQDNCQLNNLEDKITVHNFGLANKTEQTEARVAKNGISGSRMNHLGDSDKYGTELVAVKRGDDLNIDQPDILKVDTQGAELPVLKGMTDTLSHVQTIFLEAHYKYAQTRFDYTVEEMRSFIDTYGFTKQETLAEYDLESPNKMFRCERPAATTTPDEHEHQ